MTVTNGVYCGCSVWVDLNSDGDFDDLDENLYSLYTANATNTYNFNITIPAATPNGLYRMRVIASWGADGVTVGANGYGACGAYQYGNYDDFTLNVGGVAPCAAPTGLAANSITSSGATISWNATAGALAYEYVVSTNATQPVGNGTTISNSPYVATTLSPATVYYAFVRSYCGAGGYSPWSYVIFTTPSAPCLTPTGLNATSITSSTATVSWTSVAGASGYEYVIDNSASNPVGAGTSIITTSYNATLLNPATVYYLHVRTNCGGAANFSTWSTVPFTTLSAPCVAPTGVAASSISSTGATINWNTAAGALAYEYVVSTSATQPVGNGTTISNPPYIASSLTPTTVYYAYVRSYCGAGGYSPWSYVIFTTPSPTAVNDINENQLKLLVSPNPVINNMYVSITNQQGNASISLTDMFGKFIFTKKITSTSFSIDMNNLSTGIYFVHYQDAINNKTLKVIKQ
jgi:hypothetical protein